MKLPQVFSSYEGSQPKGYVFKARDGAKWEAWDMKGLIKCGWAATTELATAQCKQACVEALRAA